MQSLLLAVCSLKDNMNKKLVFNTLGALLCLFAVLMLEPTSVAIYFDYIHKTSHTWAFALMLLSTMGFGTLLRKTCIPTKEKVSILDGFAIVTLSWVFAALFGCLPYLLLNAVGGEETTFGFRLASAYFETMSGFTTTGSSVFTVIENKPPALLFWRAMTQWLGGMGIVVFAVAVMPVLGKGSYRLFASEAPGPTAERIRPHIADTAIILWGIYLALTIIEVILLMLGGMSLFEGVTYSFTTMATGGFAVHNASMSYTNSAYLHYIITIFMFLAGTNFIFHYFAIKYRFRDIWRSAEFRGYIGIVATSILLCTFWLLYCGTFDSIEKAFRYSAFNVVSMQTTTGFGLGDFDLWPNATRFGLLLLMFIGGCAGSTGGGFKVVRIVMLYQHIKGELVKMIHPRVVHPIKLDGNVIEPRVLTGTLAFLAIGIITFALGTLALTVMLEGNGQSLNDSLITSSTAVIATLNNIGPGLDAVGATKNFATMPSCAKWLLSFLMLFGRLEFFGVLLCLSPRAWRS